MKREISRSDILSLDEYARVRAGRRPAILEIKRQRRLAIGPDATLYFECYETLWHQVHEMLFIERGGEDQIAGELAAYNPLVPRGDELVATLMFEVDDPVRRAQLLAGLGGVERTLTLSFAGETIVGVPEEDVERTSAEGKASAVQFVHFSFGRAQIEAFRKPGARVVVAIGHPGYDHMAAMPEAVRAALARDFD